MFQPFVYKKTSLRSFDRMSEAIKTSRMRTIMANLGRGYALEVDDLYLEEIQWLKGEYGDDLIKSQGRIYRINII